MDKSSISFVCQNCAAIFTRWQGKCTNCGAWNSLFEETVIKSKKKHTSKKTAPVPINQVQPNFNYNISSGLSELDHVLGTGFIPDSIILLGGEPGIGKSTLALQIAYIRSLSDIVLYISGEESASQIQLRASRLGVLTENLMVLTETNLLNILECIRSLKPKLVILDSIQVIYHPDIPSISGSVNQVRFCSGMLISILKEIQSIGILIGHITKDGNLAGPKVLEHLVDIILVLEGERTDQYRTLRSFKNRFASTNEIGIFEMKSTGLFPVESPSSIFFEENALLHSGSIISAIVEGSRGFLVEVQALVVPSGYGMAKRTFLGIDQNRANLMIAAIEKILNIRLSDKDIILNIVGGFKSNDPGLDLAVVFAIISSLREKPLGRRIGICGEISLTGDIRPVRQLEKRLIEFSRMGFSDCIVSKKNDVSICGELGINPIYIETLSEALDILSSL